MEKICVVGLGYIGLPTAAIFAKAGFNVVGVDVNENAISLINKGEVHLEEVGLPEVVKDVVHSGNLRASLNVEEADVYIIAVPTPIHEDHTANVDYVISATKSILPFVKKNDVVIVESTIPPRTIDDIVAPLFEEAGWNPREDVYLAHCPERVLPGRILIELVENTRIVGGYTKEAAYQAAQVYRQIVTGEVIETQAVTAEMSKLMENTYRDVNIALANELGKISAKLGVNALDVITLANRHPRVNIHTPGPGVGGHCLAVDPYFIIEKAPELSPLISNAREINNSMPDFVLQCVQSILDKDAKIAVFGLTYKGNIDDVRESPAMEIVSLLADKGFDLSIYDPHVTENQVNFPLQTFEDAISNAECILVLTDHKEFEELDEDLIVSKMKNPVILDTKNCANIVNDSIAYYNFNNLFELINSKKEVTV
ncbi:nucleotide sugar dehydrogenase [Priestia filamentosa]|uniref:nucleotide sugar dehydrogenase n=1 Tax=Priestia filamentosa TaxID=1402861 RepID=UPI000A08F39D|nr:nucleotide sugar dehydrogenase [Priestia filamentosa]MDT3763935.1 nucleotide sugar dehydrogenase [Priestia filamentosa]OXS71589.1 UDP-N-acetyl-D-mannosamine dehydrogenase [Priestia filamentosa]WRU94344.1 nucleotide sugar dehydrogenase [Priestia filamentosa]SMF11083.1 UDP-N-acetyl-D-mannosaminuronic acid dehydrogenase [Priestia filamentosa]